MFYSKQTGGFYVTEIHGDSMPPDVVEISDELHAALMLGQSEGKAITGNSGGHPVLVDQVVSPDRVRADRDARIACTDWTQGADVLALQSSPQRAAWIKYRQALRDVPEQSGFPVNVTWPTPP